MKHFKHPNRVKWIAALLAVITGVTSVSLFFVSFFTYKMNLYNTPLEQVLEEKYEAVQDYYATEIFNNRNNDTPLPNFQNMEYGIIMSNEEDITVTDPSTYTYTEFSETKPLDTSFRRGFLTDCEYYNSSDSSVLSILTGHYSYSNEYADLEYCEPVNQIVYNEEDGFFYYVTKKYSLPILTFAVHNKNAEPKSFISKDSLSDYEHFSINKYYLSNWKEYDYDLQAWAAVPKDATYPTAYDSDSGKCKPIATKNYTGWQYIYIQDCRFPTEKIAIVSTEDLGNIVYDEYLYLVDIEEAQYYSNVSEKDLLDAENTGYPFIEFCVDTASKNKTFWFVSNVKENIDLSSNDFFAQTYKLLNTLHQNRFVYIALCILFAIMCIASLTFICLAARCQKNQDTLTISFWHRIPLLIYLAGMGTLTIASLAGGARMADSSLRGTIYLAIGFTLAIICLAISAGFCVITFMNLVTRFCGKVFWRYTIMSHIVSAIKKLWRLFQKNTSLFLKGGLIYLLICIAQLVLLCAGSYGDSDKIICLCLLFIVVTAPVYFYSLLQLKKLQDAAKHLAEGNFQEKIDTQKMLWEFKKHGEYLNKVNAGMTIALQEQLKSERFRTELITNVSHDIKTPLTSIINYIDLLQKKNITEVERNEYLEVLERQSARLKKLIEDLMEASKASTGNLTVNPENCDIDILLTQTIGEFEEKLNANNLELIIKKLEQPICIQADNRHLWRIFDNLMNNICKYAQPGTRVYINQEFSTRHVKIVFLNISKYALNISGDELMERFVRGDSSRNTEGSGLGLSIARSLAELMQGTLEIKVEGDLFKVVLSFPKEILQNNVD